MSKMYIVNVDDASAELGEAVLKFGDIKAPTQVEVDELEAAFKAAEDDMSLSAIFETDAPVDNKTRELILFGMAFESSWCMDDIYIAVFHGGTDAWVQEH